MKYEELFNELKVHGQEHLLHFYEELTEEEQKTLLENVSRLDLSYAEAFARKGEEIQRGTIEPLKAMTLAEEEAHSKEYREAGIRALREGRAAAVLLAGGMGTRLGTDGPKGCFDLGITRPVYIFQRLIENLQDSVKEAGAYVHLLIMTGEPNDRATRSFLKEHDFFGYPEEYVHFFVQDTAPAVDENGKILLESKTAPAVSPNGNGGWYSSLKKAGFAEFLKEQGVDYLNTFAVDNVLQRICDPLFLGAVILKDAAVGAKVTAKTGPDEKVGVVCLEDGHPAVVEYTELSEEMRNARDADGRLLYNWGYINNCLFRMEDLERASKGSMPLHFAHKKVPYVDAEGQRVTPSEPNAWKFEYFIFDIFKGMKSCLPFEVVREKEFAPVKNPTGVDSVESARELLKLNGYQL